MEQGVLMVRLLLARGRLQVRAVADGFVATLGEHCGRGRNALEATVALCRVVFPGMAFSSGCDGGWA